MRPANGPVAVPPGYLRGTNMSLTPYNRTDYAFKKQPKCPHCDMDIDPVELEMWSLFDEDDHEIECPYCERIITVVSSVTWKFSTDQHNDEDGD